ncbi:MAG: CCA tRNA nucleotidyltransferase [Firmicutes bacterium]|nr:CCA tRNA nucleotidyltransferase [Bacillota bacterium]
MFRLFNRLHEIKEIPVDVMEICEVLSNRGYQAYLVGGGVRDSLLGQTPGDWDIATDARPEDVAALFCKTVPTGIRYGTVTVIAKQLPVEVTTFRSESHYLDGRRPERVSFSKTIEEDLMRRDFTINAIAYEPLHGQFVDPFEGRKDLRRKLVRAVGEPEERFREDALRMLRFFRFLAVLGFRPHRRTLKAIQPGLIGNVSPERVQTELSKLLTAPAPGRILILMKQTGLLEEILPELVEGLGVTQGTFHRYDVFTHSIKALDYSLPRLDLRWAALLHDIAKPLTRSEDADGIHFYRHEVEGEKLAEGILTRLRYSKKLVDKVALLVRWHMFSVHAASTDKALRRFIRKVGKDNALDLVEVRRADILALGKQVEHSGWQNWQTLKERVAGILCADAALNVTDLKINGMEVMGVLGISPGPKVGQALEWLLDQVVEEPGLNDSEKLKSLLHSFSKKQ